MTGKTHCITAVAAAITIIQPEPQALILGASLAFLGGLTPDVDLFQSKLGRKVSKFMISIVSVMILLILLKQSFQFDLNAYIPVNDLIARLPQGPLLFLLLCSLGLNTKHRTFTHSLIGCGLFTLCVYLTVPSYWQFFFIGILSHLILDLINKEGIALFFPLEKKFSIPLCRSSNVYANLILIFVSCLLCSLYLIKLL